MFLNGNFVAQTAFKREYGILHNGVYTIETKWQSALFQSGQCGALVGVFLAGPITNRVGYRWATILGLILMNATIFICFFSTSLNVLTVGQFFEGIPWGIFIANSPAYASEIVPISLRGIVTATLQMSWSIGGILVAGVTYATNKRSDEWAWRLPLALQWIFPVSISRPSLLTRLSQTNSHFQTPLLIIIFFAPESPYWLIRNGRKEEALRSIQRLGRKTSQSDEATYAMVERTVEIEAKLGGNPTILDLFRGTDLRRTLITCFMYASQNFAGNLIANQATFFFERKSFLTPFRKSENRH